MVLVALPFGCRDHGAASLSLEWSTSIDMLSSERSIADRGRRRARIHLRQASDLPATAGRGVAGDPGSSRLLPIPPAPPKVTASRPSSSLLNNGPAEGLAGSGRTAGWTLGGRLRTIRALRLPDMTTRRFMSGFVGSRASRPARSRSRRRERALAGCGGGASGPCRPGLKSYRKFSPARNVSRIESSHPPEMSRLGPIPCRFGTRDDTTQGTRQAPRTSEWTPTSASSARSPVTLRHACNTGQMTES